MPIDDELGARLSAYLDGEADETERRAVEEIVAGDPDAAQALDDMRQARALLRRYDTETITTETGAAAAMPDLSGTEVDHFILERRIGQGGMGEVYRALDTSLNRAVAIKAISPRVSGSSKLVDRFVREARLQARIEHPRVAHVYFVGSFDDRRYFAMEYLPGGSLEDRLRREGMLNPEEAIEIVIQVADILNSCRRHGIVHRDLKPSNVMFTAESKLKLTDFGIARPEGDEATQLTATGMTVGTPYYISPEAAQGHEVTWRSDMYSLGCTLYRLLFGRMPYQAGGPVQLALAHVKEPFPDPGTLPPGVSPELVDIVRRMMAKEPGDRFPDYESLIRALNEARPKLIEPIGPWRRLGVGALDGLVTVGTVILTVLVAAGILVNLRVQQAAGHQEQIAVLLFAAVAVLSAGLIPALSGSTLLQGLFSMKVRPETQQGQSRWRLFWRGVVGNPLATFGGFFAFAALVPLPRLRQLIGGLGFLGLSTWHLVDFVTAFIDERKRFLHDILFHTRLQHVTFEDVRLPSRKGPGGITQFGRDTTT